MSSGQINSLSQTADGDSDLLKLVQRLLNDDSVADLVTPDPSKQSQTPLMRLCYATGDLDPVLTQIWRNEDLDLIHQDVFGRSLAMHACLAQNDTMLTFALSRGFDPSSTDVTGNNIFHHAAGSGSDVIVDKLLALPGADKALKVLNCHGYSPTDIARQKRFPAIARKLTTFLRTPVNSNNNSSSTTTTTTTNTTNSSNSFINTRTNNNNNNSTGNKNAFSISNNSTTINSKVLRNVKIEPIHSDEGSSVGQHVSKENMFPPKTSNIKDETNLFIESRWVDEDHTHNSISQVTARYKRLTSKQDLEPIGTNQQTNNVFNKSVTSPDQLGKVSRHSSRRADQSHDILNTNAFWNERPDNLAIRHPLPSVPRYQPSAESLAKSPATSDLNGSSVLVPSKDSAFTNLESPSRHRRKALSNIVQVQAEEIFETDDAKSQSNTKNNETLHSSLQKDNRVFQKDDLPSPASPSGSSRLLRPVVQPRRALHTGVVVPNSTHMLSTDQWLHKRPSKAIRLRNEDEDVRIPSVFQRSNGSDTENPNTSQAITGHSQISRRSLDPYVHSLLQNGEGEDNAVSSNSKNKQSNPKNSHGLDIPDHHLLNSQSSGGTGDVSPRRVARCHQVLDVTKTPWMGNDMSLSIQTESHPENVNEIKPSKGGDLFTSPRMNPRPTRNNRKQIMDSTDFVSADAPMKSFCEVEDSWSPQKNKNAPTNEKLYCRQIIDQRERNKSNSIALKSVKQPPRQNQLLNRRADDGIKLSSIDSDSSINDISSSSKRNRIIDNGGEVEFEEEIWLEAATQRDEKTKQKEENSHHLMDLKSNDEQIQNGSLQQQNTNRLRRRRSSVSLPDLRDMTGLLVTSPSKPILVLDHNKKGHNSTNTARIEGRKESWKAPNKRSVSFVSPPRQSMLPSDTSDDDDYKVHDVFENENGDEDDYDENDFAQMDGESDDDNNNDLSGDNWFNTLNDKAFNDKIKSTVLSHKSDFVNGKSNVQKTSFPTIPTKPDVQDN